MTINELLLACYQNHLNVDVLSGPNASGAFCVGVRLRPWKQDRQPYMYLATGATFGEALLSGARKAHLDRRESLDWSIRPWDTNAAGVSWDIHSLTGPLEDEDPTDYPAQDPSGGPEPVQRVSKRR